MHFCPVRVGLTAALLLSSRLLADIVATNNNSTCDPHVALGYLMDGLLSSYDRNIAPRTQAIQVTGEARNDVITFNLLPLMVLWSFSGASRSGHLGNLRVYRGFSHRHVFLGNLGGLETEFRRFQFLQDKCHPQTCIQAQNLDT